MKKVVILSLVFIVSFVSMFLTIGNENQALANGSFPDVNSQYDGEIDYLTSRNIISGYSDGNFQPNRDVTRAEAVAMLGRALGFDGVQTGTSFSDVGGGNFASGYIKEAVEKGIIQGYNDGTFGPNDLLSRGDMSALITRAFPDIEKGNDEIFSDVPSSYRHYDAINAIYTAGITSGYADDTFRPFNDVNRIELSLFIARTMNNDFRVKVASIPVQPTPPEVIEGARLAEVTGTSLNVRPTKGTEYTEIGKLPKYSPVFVLEEQGSWAKINYKGSIGYIHTGYLRDHDLNKYKGQLNGKTIVIDAGHGGKDPGAVANGLREKDVALDTSLMLQLMLYQAGAEVIMTRSEDVFLELNERATIANNSGADIFVSVHANAFMSTVHGTETYYQTRHQAEQSKLLANTIQSRLLAKLNTHDRGVKEGNFHVIRETKLPSVLVELGFITNEAEANRIRTEAFRYDAAEAMLEGIFDYFGQ